MTFLEAMQFRHACKAFDSQKKVSTVDQNSILEFGRLSPSSFGLEPWHFIVLNDSDLREKIKPACWGQAQITDADTLIVFCALTSMDENYVKHFIDLTAKLRGVARESMLGYEQMIVAFIKGKGPEGILQWMHHQVYIALGVFLNECAHRRIDACPMEGFDSQKFDEILKLPKQGLEAVVLCAVGYRALDDQNAHLKKVRFDKNEVFIDR